MRFSPFFFLLTFLMIGHSSIAQLISSDFGQNRIQYEHYKWQQYESPNLTFTFIDDHEKLLEAIVPLAESAYQDIKKLYEYRARRKIELIVYTDYSDFMQSNVGVVAPSVNTGGVTKVLDNKILIYFDGSHQNLKKLIREGIARALLNRMLFGNNLQEVVQNSVLMHLPDWFVEGFIAYAVEEWNPDVDNMLRDVLLSKRYANFMELAEDEPRLAGQSLFHYIARNKGAASISNLLYLTRINRSVESGFLYVFGTSLYAIAGANWYNYYASRYNQDNKNRLFPVGGELKITKKQDIGVKELSISPNGKMIAYVEHQQGAQRIVLTNIENNSRKVIFSSGARDHSQDVDENYPLIAWRKNSRELIVIHERANKPMLSYLSIEGKKKLNNTKVIKGLERILSVDVLEGGDLVLTAMKKDYSNVYLYKGGRLEAITNDKWDDLEAVAMNFKGRQGIVFASNRPSAKLNIQGDESLPLRYRDLYFYDLTAQNSTLVQLTFTPLSNEHSPVKVDENELIYLSNQSGISNRYICRLDTVVDHYQQVMLFKDGRTVVLPKDSMINTNATDIDSTYAKAVYKVKGSSRLNTNYSRNILLQSLSTNGKIADLLYRNGRYRLFVRDLKRSRTAAFLKTQFRLILERDNGIEDHKDKEKTLDERKDNGVDRTTKEELEQLERDIKNNTTQDTAKVDIDNYLFQSEFDNEKDPTQKDPNQAETPDQPIELIEGEDGEIIRKMPEDNAKRIVKNEPKAAAYDPSKKKKYKNTFKLDQLTFQLDNTPLFWGMDLYLQGHYHHPSLGVLFKTSFIDLLEDYNLEIGARMPVNFNGIEYFISFEDRKYRLDKKYSLYRMSRIDNYILTDSMVNLSEDAKGRTIKYMAMAEFKYPLSKFSALRATATLLSDRVAIIAKNLNTLQVPIYNEFRFGSRLEYVFDNTIRLRLNAQKGTRMRVFADYFQAVEKGENHNSRLEFGSATFALGLDARRYISFDNKTIFAFRFAGASSFGQKKMLYSLGGMENWMFPYVNQDIPIPDEDKFAYQVATANLRGFRNNIRNGSNFALINAEMRIPITAYLSRNPPKNILLRSLQLVAFYDVGTAWQGRSPFSKDNPLNISVIDPGTGTNSVSPIRVQVNYYRSPIIQGAGFGIRTVLLGYFLRMDYAWGIETGKVKAYGVYLSLGTDF